MFTGYRAGASGDWSIYRGLATANPMEYRHLETPQSYRYVDFEDDLLSYSNPLFHGADEVLDRRV